MRRDLDVIRDLLLEIEQFEGFWTNMSKLVTPERDKKTVAFHLSLLADAGYIDYQENGHGGSGAPNYTIRRLTSSGCDYLDNIRDKSVWGKTKTTLEKVGGVASLEIVKLTSNRIIQELLHLAKPDN